MKTRRRLNAATALVLVLTGCTTQQFSTSQFRRHMGNLLIPPQTEYQLGQQVAQQVESQERVLSDPNIQAYVQEVGVRIAQHAQADRPDVRFQFKVIDKPDVVNAFAIPGGHVYVYTGLLRAAENEAEFAGVMAHEIGHVIGRHSANQMAAQYGVEMLNQIAFGRAQGQLARIASQFATKGAMSKFSRDDEREADWYGVKYMIGAGYDPRGLSSFFKKLLEREKGSRGFIDTLLSTHPTTQERIRDIEALIQQAGSPRGETGRERFLSRTASLRPR